MMPGDGGRRRQSPCPLLRTPPTLARALCVLCPGRLRLLPLALHPHINRRLLHPRLHVRCIFAAAITVVSMVIFISYKAPSQYGIMGWLPWPFGASAPCELVCPALTSNDLWRPVAILSEHKCLQMANLPVPCPTNRTFSDLLEMPPIQFLSNYKAPCWYENLPLGDQIPGTPYTRNLFTCFSPNARTLFLEMHAEWAVSTQLASNPKRLRCLPYFYIAGMPKCGSTDLYRKVTQHPEVVRPPMKESHWWSKNRFGVRLNYSSLIPLDQYVDLFDKAALKIESHAVELTSTRKRSISGADQSYHPMVTGDGSASTLWDNDDWWRLPENCGRDEPLYTNANYIRHLTPHARVLVILRQPTDRLFSDYLYFQKTNKSLAEFHEHVVLSVSKLKSCMEQLSLRACVYDKRIASGVKVRLRVGIYYVYLAEWLKVFSRDQILVIRLEDYAKNLKQTTRRVYDFLGLRKLSREEEEKILQSPIANARKKKDKELGFMWEDTHRLLRDFYQPHNEKLADLLGDPRFLWSDVHSPTNVSSDYLAGADNHTRVSESEDDNLDLAASNSFIVQPVIEAGEPANGGYLATPAGQDPRAKTLGMASINLDQVAANPGYRVIRVDDQGDEGYDTYEDGDEYDGR